MAEKFYALATRTASEFTQLRNSLIAELKSINLPSTEPARKVEQTKDIKHSKTKGEFKLTDEEAAALKKDSRIKYIHLSMDEHPELFKLPLSDVLLLPTNNTLTNRYQNPIINSAIHEFNQTLFTTNINQATSQLLRLTQKKHPWVETSQEAHDGLGQPPVTHETEYYLPIQQKGAGEDVDLIVADDGCWFGHVEFITSGVTNAENPTDYIGGNVLPGNGYCDVLDVILDGPYYIDPDWFNEDPDNRLMTRWDGTIVPTELAAHNWWGDETQRSAKFNDIGTVSLGNLYTRDNVHGSPTTQPYTLYNPDHSYGPYVTNGFHGTPCASLAYGRTKGWAYNANKWSIAIIGTPINPATNSGDSLSDGDVMLSGIEKSCDIVKLFHQNKPINPKYGTKNPTVMSNSWGLTQNLYFKFPTYNKFYHFQNTGPVQFDHGLTEGTPNYQTKDGWPNFLKGIASFISGKFIAGSSLQSEIHPNSMLEACGELVTSGVIFLAAAGNETQTQVNPGNPNYDNRLTRDGVTDTANGNFGEASSEDGVYTEGQYFLGKFGYSEGGIQQTGTTNRRGFPRHAGVNQNGDFSEINIQTFENSTNIQFPVISIGALNQHLNRFRHKVGVGPENDLPHLTTHHGAKETIAPYSNKGEAIDIFAPADRLLAASLRGPSSLGYSDANKLSARLDNTYPDLNSFSNLKNTGLDSAELASLQYTINECKDNSFNGTSAACPVAAGWLSTIIQYNRGWTYQDVRNYLQNVVEDQPGSDFYTGSVEPYQDIPLLLNGNPETPNLPLEDLVYGNDVFSLTGPINTNDPHSETWLDRLHPQGAAPKVTYVETYDVSTPIPEFIKKHLISSSLFIQSGSIAQFKNGINVTGSFYNEGPILASNFVNMIVGSDPNSLPLNLGQEINGIIVTGSITVPTNTPITIKASGNFDTFCFIENQTLTEIGAASTWETVSKGGSNGLTKKDNFTKEGGYSSPGIYEYLVIASNNTLRRTSVKGIIVNVTS